MDSEALENNNLNKKLIESTFDKLNSYLKPMFGYYGGKITLARQVLKLIPPHRQYVEPFFGGGAVFFAKPLAKINCINDINSEIINIYLQAIAHKDEFVEMFKKLPYMQITARAVTRKLLLSDDDPFFRAVMHMYIVTISYNHSLNGGPAVSKSRSHSPVDLIKDLDAKIEKIARCHIYNMDAISTIKMFDDEDTLFYLDPPYPEANQGHYRGYKYEDYEKLLDVLYDMKGKFILSSYRSNIEKYDLHKKFNVRYIQKPLTAQKIEAGRKRRQKTEALVYNYEINKDALV